MSRFSKPFLGLSCSILLFSAVGNSSEALSHRTQILLRKAKEVVIEKSKISGTDLRDLSLLQNDFLNWKSEIEKSLLAPPSPPFSDSSRVQLISDYFTQLTQLLSVRIGLKQPHDRAWQMRFALSIPEDQLALLPGLAALNQDRAGNKYYSLTYQDHHLRLSDSLVLGVETHWLTYTPHEPGFVALVHLLTFRQLVENLAELRTLMPERKIAPLAVPASLLSFNHDPETLEALMKDHQRAMDEPALRNSLAKTIHSAVEASVQSRVRFSDSAFIHEFSEIISTTPEFTAQLESRLGPAFDETIEQGIASMLESQIASSSLPLSEIAAPELERLLRHWYATAHADTILTKLIQYINQGVLHLTSIQRAALISLIDRRRNQFEGEILAIAMASWNRQARQNAREIGPAQKKSLLTENLLRDAARIQRIRAQGAALAAPPDLEILAKIIEPWLLKKAPRDSVRSAFREIVQTGDYFKGQKLYFKTLKQWKNEQAKPRAAFSKNVSPELTEHLHSRMITEKEKDIRDLEQIGFWISLDTSFPTKKAKKITAADIVTQPENRKLYEDLAVEKIFQANPLLATEVDVGEAKPQILANVLGWMMEVNQGYDRPKKYIAASTPFVDQALQKAESKIRETAQTLSSAKSIADIEIIATSSLNLGLVLQAYPEYIATQKQALDNLLRPSLDARLTDRYIEPFLSWGFSAILVLEVARWSAEHTAPVAALFMENLWRGLNPLVNGYLRTAIPVSLLQAGTDIHDILRKGRKARMAQALFFSAWNEGTNGRGWMDFGEMSLYQSHYEWSKWVFAGHLALDGIFFYYPQLEQILAHFPKRIELPEFLEDCAAFEKLGLKPGKWSQVEAAYNTHPAEREAYLRLAGKIQNQNTWNAEAIASHAKAVSESSALQKLLSEIPAREKDPT